MVKRKLREPLEDRKGNLFFDGFSVKELAEKYDTPLYVIKRETHQRQLQPPIRRLN